MCLGGASDLLNNFLYDVHVHADKILLCINQKIKEEFRSLVVTSRGLNWA